MARSRTQVTGIMFIITGKLTVLRIARGCPLDLVEESELYLTFRHRASCILGQAFHYSPENAFYIFNQQIYLII